MSQITDQNSLTTAPWDRDLPPRIRAQIHARLHEMARVDQQRIALFRESLGILIELGIRENAARALIGKWRKAYPGQDDMIVEAVRQAGKHASPDPAAYITATLAAMTQKNTRTARLCAHRYRLLGWERPVMTSRGPQYQHERRGQIWLDEFGQYRIIPPPADTPIPSLEEDPGYSITRTK